MTTSWIHDLLRQAFAGAIRAELRDAQDGRALTTIIDRSMLSELEDALAIADIVRIESTPCPRHSSPPGMPPAPMFGPCPLDCDLARQLGACVHMQVLPETSSALPCTCTFAAASTPCAIDLIAANGATITLELVMTTSTLRCASWSGFEARLSSPKHTAAWLQRHANAARM